MRSICSSRFWQPRETPQSCTSSVRSVVLCSNAPIRYATPLSPISSLSFSVSTARVSFVISAVDSVAAPSVPMRFKSRCSSASVVFLNSIFPIFFVASSVIAQSRRLRNVMVRLRSIASHSLIASRSPMPRPSRSIAFMLGSALVFIMLSIWGGMRLFAMMGMCVGLFPPMPFVYLALYRFEGGRRPPPGACEDAGVTRIPGTLAAVAWRWCWGAVPGRPGSYLCCPC
mmetsp:Transcript_38893/g.93559  ORF Transcript_38893/g.93559 Transcript_38893/m.93559 type:complete len:228 (+) Transcript_38893:2388-3071(+)